MPGWEQAHLVGLPSSFTESLLWYLIGHTQHLHWAIPFSSATWRGGLGRFGEETWVGILWSLSQRPDRHQPGLCLGGDPVWACRLLLQRAALLNLETVHKYRQLATCICLAFLLSRSLMPRTGGQCPSAPILELRPLPFSFKEKTHKSTKPIKAIRTAQTNWAFKKKTTAK